MALDPARPSPAPALPLPRDAAPTPLFHRVETALRRAIADATYPAGSALPPEPALCRQFRVSRATIRRAVDALVQEGLVYRRQGAGTFVADAHINVELMELRGFVEELRAQGYLATVSPLERRIIPAPADVAARLGVASGDPTIYLRRLLGSEGEALALSHGFFPYRTCAALLDSNPAGTIYEVMEQELGLEIAYAEQIIAPRMARADEARLLGIKPRDLLLFIERTTYVTSGEPVHFGRILLRADRYQATMVLRRHRRRTLPLETGRGRSAPATSTPQT